jgi:nicotinamidase-related amidase
MMPEPGNERVSMAKVHGQGPAERVAVYDPAMAVAPHVFNKDRRYALLVVDMLNDFLFGKIKCERAVPMIPRSAQLADAARGAGVPVFYSNDSHTRKDFEVQRWGEHAMRGTKGARVISDLRPRKKDQQIPKTTYSSFFNTRLERELKRTYDGKGANTLVLTGLHTDCCVRHTTADAFFRGYEAVVAEDAVNSFTELQYRTGLQYLKFWYLADILPTRKIVKLF